MPRQSIRNNADRIILFEHTLRDVESMHKNIECYDMKHDEFRGLCRNACSEKLNSLRFVLTKNKKDGESRVLNESKNIYIESTPKSEAF